MRLLEAYFEEKRQEQVEAELPSALFHASTVQAAGAEEVLKALSSGYGLLSQEARRVLNAANKGESIRNALERVKKPRLLREALGFIKTAESTGADLNALLKSLAEDYAHAMELEREKKTGLALQKYSLLLAAGFLAPLVLGFVLCFAADFDASLFSTNAQVPLEAARFAVTTYIILLALMASAFAAFLDGKKYAALYYAALLTPTALAVFALASAVA